MQTEALSLRDLWSKEVFAFVYDRASAEWNESSRPSLAVEEVLSAFSRAPESVQHLACIAHLLGTGAFSQFAEAHLSKDPIAISKERIKTLDESAGLHGSIDWPRTILRRQSTSNAAAFVTRRLDTSYNSSENRVLSAYLGAVTRAIDEHQTRGGVLPPTTVEYASWAVAAKKSVYLRDISGAPLRDYELRRARRHRFSIYREAERLLIEIESLKDEKRLKELMMEGWLLPKSDDALFETLILVRTLKVLFKEISTGDAKCAKLWPLALGRQEMAAFSGPGTMAKVYYDRSPHTIASHFKLASYKQSQMLRWYDGMESAIRRPDILIEIHREGKSPRWLLVEAKNTSGDSQYARDSIYKVIGYLSDFADLWPTDAPKLKSILAIRNGVQCLDLAAALQEPIVIASIDSFEGMLSSAISTIMA